MKLRELMEEIEEDELKKLEVELDRLFKKYNIDIEFTYHFKQRMNDPRNKDPITIYELGRIFREARKKYGEKMSVSEESFEAVLKELASNINIPFILKDDPANEERDLVAKIIMRKPNFGTPNPVFEV